MKIVGNSISFISKPNKIMIISVGKGACPEMPMSPEGMKRQQYWYKSMRAGGCQDVHM